MVGTSTDTVGARVGGINSLRQSRLSVSEGRPVSWDGMFVGTKEGALVALESIGAAGRN